MGKEGKYIYCIIETKQERNFGQIGVGGQEVMSIGYGDLSMVVSNTPMNLSVTSENMLTHQKVIEEVMKEFNVLPMSFGNISDSAEGIRNFLDRRQRELRNLLRNMDNKIEMGVKAIWMNMDKVFMAIVEENQEIKRFKEAVIRDGDMGSRINLGKMVADALERKKENEAENIMSRLKGSALDYKLNRTFNDRMFLNAAFLVSRGREREFDNIMNDLGETYGESAKFMYVGPLPPYNFVDITIHPQEWEA